MRRRGVVRQDAGPEEEIRKLVQLGRANTQSCRGHVPLNGSGSGFAACAAANVLNHGHSNCWAQYT